MYDVKLMYMALLSVIYRIIGGWFGIVVYYLPYCLIGLLQKQYIDHIRLLSSAIYMLLIQQCWKVTFQKLIFQWLNQSLWISLIDLNCCMENTTVPWICTCLGIWVTAFVFWDQYGHSRLLDSKRITVC